MKGHGLQGMAHVATALSLRLNMSELSAMCRRSSGGSDAKGRRKDAGQMSNTLGARNLVAPVRILERTENSDITIQRAQSSSDRGKLHC